MFLAIKYCHNPYILLSCYLKNTTLSDGKVNVTGDKVEKRLDIVMKNKKPVIEFHIYLLV